MAVSERAGKPAEPSMLVDVDRLIDAYYDLHPEIVPVQGFGAATVMSKGVGAGEGGFDQDLVLHEPLPPGCAALSRRESEVRMRLQTSSIQAITSPFQNRTTRNPFS